MSTAKKPGVVATIKKFIADNEGKPFTHEDIHAELIKEFPDREAAGMMGTIKTWAVPGEMKKLGYLLVKEGKQYTARRVSPEGLPTGKEPGEMTQPAAEKIKKDAPPSPLRIFHYTQDKAEELPWRQVSLELEIQCFIEKHMEVCLEGIRFVASEFTIEDGRIDSLGIDKNNCPVIIEYKRNINENVVGQAITYSFSISRHKPYFQLPVLEKFGESVAKSINWKNIRVLCIAEDFTQYDKSNAKAHADKHIELIRYKFFSDNTLALEWVAGNMPK